jgi:regulatory protein
MIPESPTGAESLARGLDLACTHINRRERTVDEVRAHLERKGVAATTAEAVVDELRETRLLDDERFAAMFVADKRELEQWGTERIRRGLAARGIDRELAERALAEAEGEEGAGALAEAAAGDPRPGGELGRALELLRRRFPDPPRERRDRDRALGVLLRKGYEGELALDALAAHARGE